MSNGQKRTYKQVAGMEEIESQLKDPKAKHAFSQICFHYFSILSKINPYSVISPHTSKSKYNQQMLFIRKKINKNDVCCVIRVDKEKGNIDLSKRKIDPEQIKELEARYAKGKKVLSFMNSLANKTNVPLKYLYKQIVFPLQMDGQNAMDMF